jgi:hypothetical protein
MATKLLNPEIRVEEARRNVAFRLLQLWAGVNNRFQVFLFCTLKVLDNNNNNNNSNNNNNN